MYMGRPVISVPFIFPHLERCWCGGEKLRGAAIGLVAWIGYFSCQKGRKLFPAKEPRESLICGIGGE